MKVSVSDAKIQLKELVRRAESGEAVVLTRRGREVARLIPIAAPVPGRERRKLIDAVRTSAAKKVVEGPTAARSQDFLYDGDGLPQ